MNQPGNGIVHIPMDTKIRHRAERLGTKILFFHTNYLHFCGKIKLTAFAGCFMLKFAKKSISILLAAAITIGWFLPANVEAVEVYMATVNSRQIGGTSTILYGKTVAQLLVEEAEQHNINPRMMLTLMQRESSAITQSSPSSETRRAWPLFYMYDERMATCLNQKDPNYCSDARFGNPTYKERAEVYGGLGHQIAYSMYNFQNKYNYYLANGNYSYDTTIDGEVIHPKNIATKVLYAYTPHFSAYNTSSNFWTYYTQWWGSPNGGDYDRENVFSDANFLNTSPMTANEINSWLKSKGSWLADYVIPEYVGVPYPTVEGGAVNIPPPVPGDFNSDRVVDILDLSKFASYWGQTDPGDYLVDINQDGSVDILDLSALASFWSQ